MLTKPNGINTPKALIRLFYDRREQDHLSFEVYLNKEKALETDRYRIHVHKI